MLVVDVFKHNWRWISYLALPGRTAPWLDVWPRFTACSLRSQASVSPYQPYRVSDWLLFSILPKLKAEADSRLGTGHASSKKATVDTHRGGEAMWISSFFLYNNRIRNIPILLLYPQNRTTLCGGQGEPSLLWCVQRGMFMFRRETLLQHLLTKNRPCSHHLFRQP